MHIHDILVNALRIYSGSPSYAQSMAYDADMQPCGVNDTEAKYWSLEGAIMAACPDVDLYCETMQVIEGFRKKKDPVRFIKRCIAKLAP